MELAIEGFDCADLGDDFFGLGGEGSVGVVVFEPKLVNALEANNEDGANWKDNTADKSDTSDCAEGKNDTSNGLCHILYDRGELIDIRFTDKNKTKNWVQSKKIQYGLTYEKSLRFILAWKRV